MNKTKLLAMILVFCMVFSNLAMSASAVTAPVDSVKGSTSASEDIVVEEDSHASDAKDLIVSGENATSGINTMKNAEVLKSDLVDTTGTASSAGSWTISAGTAPGTSLLQQETPDCLEELKKASEIYSANEVVHAFVVMEDAPLADTHTSPALVSAYVEKQMIEKQNTVISSIERTVLHGRELKVRYQFTYLTNSFSIETEFANLEKIAAIDGVKSVSIMPVYNAIPVEEGTASPNTSSAADMTGVEQVRQEFGYTGAGMKIAIIDTGLDLDHPSFAADPKTTDDSMVASDIDKVLGSLNATVRYWEENKKDLTSADLYRSKKVPFAFNYCDDNLVADHSSDSQGDHGTHVSGIAAANAVEGTNVVGMAPDAQIIVMKVFGANGGAYTDDIVAALEDAMTLGCDVVNASLGSAAGFTSTDSEYDLIYQRLASQDIVACISAGNEGTSASENMWGTDLNRTSNPDNATVGQPGIYANVMTIASANNSTIMGDYFTVGGEKIFYMDNYEYLLGTVTWSLRDLAGKDVEYVIVPGLGEEDDYEDLDVEGKIAIVKRGTLSFAEKVENAESFGAAACIIWNNNDDDDVFSFGMTTSDSDTGYVPSIPVGLISLTDGNKMEAAETKVLNVSKELAGRPSTTGGQMSSFSSWGVAPDLGLEPDITGIGGNVYSCYDGGKYGLMSGTSMSSPQVAGTTALVMQRLKELYPNALDGTIRSLAEALLMSTADPIISTDSQVEVSPRQQGAGLVNAYKAVTSTVYLTVGGEKPKAELGDSATGKYSFSFEIHNIGTEAVTYTLNSTLLTELAVETGGVYFMSGQDMELTGEVTYDKNTVTVPAGGKADVIVRIVLSDADKEYFQTKWVNGGYVEGFVYLTSTDDEGIVTSDLSLPFLGFYGDWTDAPVFDTAYWYDNSFWSKDTVDGMPEGDEYYHVFWTSLAGTDWVLGMNPYSGAVVGEDGKVIYDPSHNVVSPNGDGIVDGLEEIYLSLLRNAKTLTLTYTVGDEIVHRETYTNNSKTMYNSSYGQVVPWLYSWKSDEMYDFTDANGKALPDGTTVMLTIDANVDYGTGGDHTIQIPITIDVTAPELLKAETEVVDGKDLLTLTVKDASLAAILVMNHSGTRTYAKAYDHQTTDNGDGTYTVQFDISDKGTEFTIAVCDYGGNESYFDISYEAEDGNLPEVDEGTMFAYRVYDSSIGTDHMYGWVSLNLEKGEEGNNANIGVWTDDYMEYASLVAAEYVDGKIFAVDAVYNLVVMDPGLFDRNTVCNLGVHVLDMTFDDSTGTMYVLSKNGSYTALYTMDLLTGELTKLKDYGWYSMAPWAIADDDNGTLYAIKYNSSNLYTLDENYAMVAVTDADGNKVVIKESDNKNKVSPSYAQTMTYLDGKLYWAYYRSNWAGESSNVITFDVTDQTVEYYTYVATGYNSDNELIKYKPGTELNGMLVINPTTYKIPASTELTNVTASVDSVLLRVGDSKSVSATSLPWNYEVKSTTWTSSDTSVATVDNGVIKAVGAGEATVTVTMDGKSATIKVTAVAVDGNVYAYNYYSADGYYGTLIDIDLGEMDYTLGTTVPVDFLAGEYNGHTGIYYGYSENGQLYAWDIEGKTYETIGLPVGTYPADMAYDYSTGILYALFTDLSTYESKIVMVNTRTGSLETVCQVTTDYYIFGGLTLACDSNGTLYMLDYDGTLYTVDTENYELSEDLAENLHELGSMTYAQSMCWDYKNNVLIWGYADGASINWIDVEKGYMLELGDPTESGMFEFMSLYTIPETIPTLPNVAVESIEANDMTMMVGSSTVADINVYPFNATNQDLILTSSDPDIVSVNNGMVTAVSAGTATISYSLTDGDKTYTGSIKVTALQGADNIRAYLMSDFSTGYGQIWMELHPENTAVPTAISATDYTIYCAEQVGDVVYAYGFDPNDWEAKWQFFTLDPENYDILSTKEMVSNFPFMFDMTYDYVTDTLYCTGGGGSEDLDIYIIDRKTGAATLLLNTEQNFMSIAAGRDGYLYAVENSVSEFDPLSYSEVFAPANLYKISTKTLEIQKIGSTGVTSNMMGSMAYDYDTDTLYWAWTFRADMWGAVESGFSMVDPETAESYNMGMVSIAGAQVTCMMIGSDNQPVATNSELYNALLTPAKSSLNVGNSTRLNLTTIPTNLDGAQITWSSSNKNVATVDGNGTVTAVGAGKATITAKIVYNGKTIRAKSEIAVLDADASFLTWNQTDMGWAKISRADYSVTNITEGETDGIGAMANVGDVVYGYSLDNVLFKLNSDYTRTTIGADESESIIQNYINDLNLKTYTVEDFKVEIRDMAYDKANDRMLVLLGVQLYDVYSESVAESNACNYVYSVDLTTGKMKSEFHFTETYNNYGLTCSADGSIYVYCGYNGNIYVLDLEKQSYTTMVSLQSEMLYPDFGQGIRMGMHYDSLTECIYILFTQNSGNCYLMCAVDSASGTISWSTDDGDYLYVGEVTNYVGDCFTGLTYLGEICDCVDANNDHKCDICGSTLTECIDEDPCDHKCDICGAAMGEHVAADGKHTCDYCGEKVTECVDNNHDGKCDICGAILSDVIRLSGKNRYATAIKVADEMKEVLGEKFDAIIIAAGENFADALAGSYLSSVKNAPILLSWGKGGSYAYLDTNNIDYIKANLAENGTIYILGGTAAVPASYDEALNGYTVKRLSGKNRFDTNVAILKEAGIAEGSEILVCTAYNYADSLSASATGKPILLVSSENGTLYGVNEEYLSTLKDCSFTIIGGTGAVGSDIADAIKTYGNVDRVSGKNRYQTSIMVAERYFENADSAVVAYGLNYPDGLCGGSMASAMNVPLILTAEGSESIAANYAKDHGIKAGYVLGGEKFITDSIARTIFQVSDDAVILAK